MKLGLVTKPEKTNKTESKKIDNDVMLDNCDVITINLRPISSFQKLDSGLIVL